MRLKRKRYKLPTTLNTTAKDKTQNAAQQKLIKNAARHTCPSEVRAIKYNSAVESRGTRDERAGASPHGGPLTRLVVIVFTPLTLYKITFLNVTLRRSPAGSVPCDAGQNNAKINFPPRHNYHKELCSFHPDEKLANAHTVKLKIKLSSRKPQVSLSEARGIKHNFRR